MKYGLLLLFTQFIFVLNVYSQSFVNDSNKWHIADCGFEDEVGLTCFVRSYKFDSTVVIEDKVYKELFRTSLYDSTSFESTQRFYREEGDKVYMRDMYTPEEFLIYDFSKEVGDTLNIGYGFSKLELEIVDQDTLVLTSGEKRKVWTVVHIPSNSTEEGKIIEGIGSLYAPMWPTNMFTLDFWSEIRCFYYEEIEKYRPENEYGYGDCYLDIKDTTVFVAEVIKNNEVKVYPNPFTSSLVVDFSDVNKKVIVNIYSLTGKLVYESNLIEEKEVLELDNLKDGFYLAKVFIDGVLASTIKLLKDE